MSQVEVSEEDILLAQRIISAAERHDVEALKIQLQHGSANVMNPTTKTSPLHAAVASCPDLSKTEKAERKSDEAAEKTVALLLQEGAIWNDLNKDDETPGCIAHRLGQDKIYDQLVAAGVRAELLLSKMAEMGLAPEPEPIPAEGEEVEDVSIDNHLYLKSKLRYREGILLDDSDNAVMMDWEAEIMGRHAETLLPTPGLVAINVGHGMGIVDRAIQTRSPKHHHIIEAHPEVWKRLRETGWYDKPNVTVHEGRWQEVLPKLVEQGVELDGIYYDTFAEDYNALKEFFTEWVPQLMSPKGMFGWYNGLGADRQICYDVYTQVAEMDLYAAGFDTKWEDIPVPKDLHGSSQWDGTRRPYWTIDVYRLPINTFIA